MENHGYFYLNFYLSNLNYLIFTSRNFLLTVLFNRQLVNKDKNKGKKSLSLSLSLI